MFSKIAFSQSYVDNLMNLTVQREGCNLKVAALVPTRCPCFFLVLIKVTTTTIVQQPL